MNQSTKTALILMGLAGAAAAILWWYPTSERTDFKSALQRRELALRVLGEYLARHYPGERALVVGNPFTRQRGQPKEIHAFEAAAIRGLAQGWQTGVKLQAVVYPEIKPEFATNPTAAEIDSSSPTPLSFLTTDAAWDQLMVRYPETGLLVSLIGLPANLTQTQVWQHRGKPRFALLLPDLRMIGKADAIQSAFHSGKLAALVLNKPGAPPEAAALARDVHAEFDRRFLLVTAENWDAIVRTYPQMF